MSDRKLFPLSHPQNPAPVKETGQEWDRVVRGQVENILARFYAMLPDSYVSEVPGPNYVLQFQAIAEELARIQVSVQEVYEDLDFDFIRSEYLYQILGLLVFPRAEKEGIPVIEGDISYRSFLQQMVILLLEGSKPASVKAGVELLTDATIEIIEKGLAARDNPLSLWDINDQFSFELNISSENSDAFPEVDPIVLQENIRLVLKALKPAHTIYDLRFVFRENFGFLFEDEMSWEMDTHYYDDMRKFCGGIKQLSGSSGNTLSNLLLFQDTTRDFRKILPGAVLTINSGDNAGVYSIVEVSSFLFGDDSTARNYVTSPTGLSGTATISGGVIEDPSQNWGLAEEGEVITFLDGPNVGSYRLYELLSDTGGLVGVVSGSATKVSVSPTILKVKPKMVSAVTGQSYTVTVDRLGVKTLFAVSGEDVSAAFYL